MQRRVFKECLPIIYPGYPAEELQQRNHFHRMVSQGLPLIPRVCESVRASVPALDSQALFEYMYSRRIVSHINALLLLLLNPEQLLHCICFSLARPLMPSRGTV